MPKMQNFWFRLFLAGLAIWLAVIGIWAAFVFLVPHGPNYAPEVGPTGIFQILGIIFSVGYFGIFCFFIVPILYFIRQLPRRSQSGGYETDRAA